MPPKKKAETITGVCEAKTTQWEENAISPSKFPSSARYDKSQAVACRDKDNVLWGCVTSELTNAQINDYLQLTRHLKQDTALAILRDSAHDIASAVEICNNCEEIPDLSLLEVKVLRDATPVPYTVINGELNDSTVDPEKHIFGLLSHVPPSVIRDQYYRTGRELLYGSPTGWQSSLDRLERAGLVSEEVDSPLYKKQGGRTLRSSAFVADAPTKRGRTDKLAIAMVGFDQKKALKDDDAPIRRHPFPLPSFNRTVAPPIDRRSASNQNRRPIVHIRRGRSLNYLPLVPSPLVAPPSSSSIAPPVHPSSIPRKPRRDPLEIDMNWRAIDNGARTRRQATAKKDNGSAEEEEEMENRESSSERATPPFGIGRDSSVFGASVIERANTNLENFTNLASRYADLESFGDMCNYVENRLRGEQQIVEVFDEEEEEEQ